MLRPLALNLVSTVRNILLNKKTVKLIPSAVHGDVVTDFPTSLLADDFPLFGTGSSIVVRVITRTVMVVWPIFKLTIQVVKIHPPINEPRTYLSCNIYPNLCVFGAYSWLWTFCCNYVWSIYSSTTPTMDRVMSSNGSFSSDCTCYALSTMLTWDQALLLLLLFLLLWLFGSRWKKIAPDTFI